MSISQSFGDSQRSLLGLANSLQSYAQLQQRREQLDYTKKKQRAFVQSVVQGNEVTNAYKDKKELDDLKKEVVDLKFQQVRKQQVEDTNNAQEGLSEIVNSKEPTYKAIATLNGKQKFRKVLQNIGVNNLRAVPRSREEFEGMVAGKDPSSRADLIEDLFNFSVLSKDEQKKSSNLSLDGKLSLVLDKTRKLRELEDSGDNKVNNLVMYDKGGKTIVSDLENILSNTGLSSEAKQLTKRAVVDTEGEEGKEKDLFGVNPITKVSPEQYRAMDEQDKTKYKTQVKDYIKALDTVTNDGKYTQLGINQQMADAQRLNATANYRRSNQKPAGEEKDSGIDLYKLYGDMKKFGGAKTFFKHDKELSLGFNDEKKIFGANNVNLYTKIIDSDLALASKFIGKSAEDVDFDDLKKFYTSQGLGEAQINTMMTEFAKRVTLGDGKGLVSPELEGLVSKAMNTLTVIKGDPTNTTKLGLSSRANRFFNTLGYGKEINDTNLLATQFGLISSMVGNLLYGGALTDGEAERLDKIVKDIDWTNDDKGVLGSSLSTILGVAVARKKARFKGADQYTRASLNGDIKFLQSVINKTRNTSRIRESMSSLQKSKGFNWLGFGAKVDKNYDNKASNLVRNIFKANMASDSRKDTILSTALQASSSLVLGAIVEKQKSLGLINDKGEAKVDKKELERNSRLLSAKYLKPIVEEIGKMDDLSKKDKIIATNFVQKYNDYFINNEKRTYKTSDSTGYSKSKTGKKNFNSVIEDE